MQLPVEVRSAGSPGAKAVGIGELPDVGARN